LIYFFFQNALSSQDTNQLIQVMTSNKVETEKPVSSRTKVSTVTDDVNTESYHTSGIIRFFYFFFVWNIFLFVEVIRMMNKPTDVRCINTPNGSTADDTSTSSACKFKII